MSTKKKVAAVNPWQRRAEVAKREGGVWVTVAEYPGWRFKVGRDCPWNADHARAMARVMAKPTVRAYLSRVAVAGYELTEEDREVDRRMVLEAFAEGLLVEWEGVTAEDGDAMVADVASKISLLEHFPDIYAALLKASRDPKNFEPSAGEKAEIAAGN